MKCFFKMEISINVNFRFKISFDSIQLNFQNETKQIQK